MRASRGFTLLEVLVALAIFAVLGLMSSQMLTRIIKSPRRAVTRGDQLGELQRAMQIMQRDVPRDDLHVPYATKWAIQFR